MKELRLIIDNPKLEKELDKFELVTYWRAPKEGQYFLRLDGVELATFDREPSYLYIILTPKPQPPPAPDWSKLGFLQPGWWVAMDSDGEFYAYEREPRLLLTSFEAPTSCSYSLKKDLFGAALPTISLARWCEAKWQAPEQSR